MGELQTGGLVWIINSYMLNLINACVLLSASAKPFTGTPSLMATVFVSPHVVLIMDAALEPPSIFWAMGQLGLEKRLKVGARSVSRLRKHCQTENPDTIETIFYSEVYP